MEMRPAGRAGGRAAGRAAECIQRQYAFGGSMHSEAVCNQAQNQTYCLLPIAYCPLHIAFWLLPIAYLFLLYLFDSAPAVIGT